MKSVACKDASGAMCDFVATGENDEAVKSSLTQHAMEAHADMMNGMSEEQKAGMSTKVDSMLAGQM